MPCSTPWVTAAMKASPAPSPLTTSILTGGTSTTRPSSNCTAPSPPRLRADAMRHAVGDRGYEGIARAQPVDDLHPDRGYLDHPTLVEQHRAFAAAFAS